MPSVQARALRWSRRVIDWTLAAFACALGIGMLASALHDVSRGWDCWYYHFPFAAHLGGLADASSFVLSDLNRARFAGFPLLGECLQALLWRLSGSPVAANLLALSSLPLFALFLWKRFQVPVQLSTLGLLAVPLVQIHATSCYVDLPGNIAAAALILTVVDAYAGALPTRRSLLLALLFAAIASNMKFQLEPIVLVAILLLALRLAAPLRSRDQADEHARSLKHLAWIALALPLIFATPLKNILLHHNPAYPEQLRVLGWVLPGIEQPYSSSPIWLAHAPEPVRFLASIFELHLPPLASHARWTIDQWTPPSRADYRMGGFFGAYVAFELGLLAWRVARERTRPVYSAIVGFALLTGVISVLPQAHELRYYLCWMLVLVSLNLWLAGRQGARAPASRMLGVASALCVSLVLFSTRFTYVYPSGITFPELVARQVDAPVLATISDGERVCSWRLPFALLWAAPFHPPRHYQLKQAETLAGCKGYRPLD